MKVKDELTDEELRRAQATSYEGLTPVERTITKELAQFKLDELKAQSKT